MFLVVLLAGGAPRPGAGPHLPRAIAEPVSIAFATTSSEAALPRAMEAMERLGVPRPIVAFVMPTGYSFNLDGSTLYLSLAAVFVAQAAGIELGVGQQLAIVFTLMLTSKGVAGVPRATLVILLGTAASFGLPHRGHLHHPRHRRADGHGAHGGQRDRQDLSGDGGDRALGGDPRVGREPTQPEPAAAGDAVAEATKAREAAG